MGTRMLAAVAVALLVVTASVEAQGRGGYGGGFGGHEGWGGMMRHGGERMQPPDPLLLRGPLTPDSLSTLVALSDSQRQQYTTIYDRFTKNTQLTRDSLRTTADLMRDARQNGERSAAQGYRTTMRALRDELNRQQKPFDDAMKALLTKAQWKKYEQWHKDLQKNATEERRGMRGGWPSRPR